MTDLKQVEDNERIYDEAIAPALRDIIIICEKHNIPFTAVAEWNAEQIGMTCCQVPGQCLSMTMINHCVKTAPNIDGYIIGLLRYAKKSGIDYSSSIVMQKMDGKL